MAAGGRQLDPMHAYGTPVRKAMQAGDVNQGPSELTACTAHMGAEGDDQTASPQPATGHLSAASRVVLLPHLPVRTVTAVLAPKATRPTAARLPTGAGTVQRARPARWGSPPLRHSNLHCTWTLRRSCRHPGRRRESPAAAPCAVPWAPAASADQCGEGGVEVSRLGLVMWEFGEDLCHAARVGDGGEDQAAGHPRGQPAGSR